MTRTLLQISLDALVKLNANSDISLIIGDLPSSLKEKLLIGLSNKELITDRIAVKLLHKGICELDLFNCDIGDETLKTAQRCKYLVLLNVGKVKMPNTNISSRALESLVPFCPHLCNVHLQFCINVTDAAVISLAEHCPNLTELNIGHCRLLTSKSLSALGKCCAKLKNINFSQTRVSDDGVIDLAKGCCALGLEEVIMERCALLTDDGIEAIVSYCPNIAILNFYGCPLLTDKSREILSDHLSMLSRLKQISWTVY